ncbi:MAG: hypothetical protein KIT57_03630 [Blastocatellales bacterium]|nr:hypothetical protein [Blastocatellales bacterium]
MSGTTELVMHLSLEGRDALGVLEKLQDVLSKTSRRSSTGNAEQVRTLKDLEAQLQKLTKGSVDYVRVQNQIAALQNRMRRQGGAADQLAELQRNINALGGRLPAVVDSLGRFTAGLGAIRPGAAAAAAGVAGLVAGIAAIGGAAAAGIAALKALGRRGVEVNAAFETIELGIATVIGSVAELRDAASGRVFADGPEKLAAAVGIAADQMAKLRIDSLETTATLKEIAPAFQAAIAPGLRAGLTIDQIRKATIDITNAVASIGLPLDQIQQETRAILSGEINRNAQAAIALGFKREEVREAIKQNRFADLLNEKLRVAAASGAAAAKTFSGALSNLQEASDIFSATVTRGLFERLRDSFNRVIPEIFDRNAENLISARFTGLADTLKSVFDRVGDAAAGAIDAALRAAADLSEFLRRNRREVENIIQGVAGIAREVVSLTERTFEWGRALLFGKSALSDIRDIADAIERELAELNVIIESVLSFTLGGIKLLGITAQTVIHSIASTIGASGIADAAAREINRMSKDIGELDARVKSAIRNYDELIERQETRRKLAQEFPEFSEGQLRRLLELDKLPAGPPKADAKGRAGVRDQEKSRTDAARKASQARIELLEVEVRTAERLLADETEAAKRAYDDRVISATQMAARIIEGEQRVADAKKRLRDAERAAADRLPELERRVKLARLHEQELADIAEFNRRVRRMRDEAGRQDDKAIRDALAAAQDQFIAHQERLFEIAETGRRQRAQDDRAAAERGDISFAEAERRAIEAERAAFAERERLTNLELARINLSTAEREKAQDALSKLAVERAGFEREATHRTIEALERDERAWKRYVDARRQNEADLARIRTEARLAEIAQDLASLDPARRRRAVRIKTDALKREEEARTRFNRDLILKSAEDEFKAAVEAGQNVAASRLRAETTANNAIEEERRRHRGEMRNIDLEGKRQESETDPFSIRSLLGDIAGDELDETDSKIEALGAKWRAEFLSIGSAAEAMAVAVNAGMSVLDRGVAAVTQGLADQVEQWVLTGQAGALAVRKLLAAQVAALAKEAVLQALKATAYGFLMLAQLRFAEAGQAFTSAAYWAALAGASGAVGRAIAGKSGGRSEAGGRDAGGGSGAATDGTAEDRTFTRGNVEGLIGGFREVVAPIVRQQEVLIRQQQEGFSQQQTSLRNQQSALEKLSETNGIWGQAARRIIAMRPGDVVGIAEGENPEAFARGTARGIERSNTSQRRLSDALQLNR